VAEQELRYLFEQKSEALRLLFWYAIQQERCGDTDLFDAILHLKKREFDRWCPHELHWHPDAWKMFTYASPRAMIFVTPYLDWGKERPSGAKDLISKWVAAISVVPHTEEVTENVVDTLLQISANPYLRSSIPADVWSWLNERPSLPPVCKGRRLGGDRDTVRTVRGLNKGILASYLIMIWSEWKPLSDDGFAEMRISVCEDFNGVGNVHHRAELIQRLDYVLGELDRLSGSPNADLEDDKLWRDKLERHSPVMKDRYGELKRILDQETTDILECMPPCFFFLSPLTLMDLHRIPLHLHACPPSPAPVTSHLERSALGNCLAYSHSTSSLFPTALLVDLERS